MKKVKIIAELGWNAIGDMSLMKDMIIAAKENGADYAKFQTWKVNRLKPGPWDDDGRRQIYEKAELSVDDHHELHEFCHSGGIKFLTSCFCHSDLNFIRTLTNEVKIPSPEVSYNELVSSAISMFDHVYLSTGASIPLEYMDWASFKNITLLHCVSSYPCPPENFNFHKLRYIKLISEGRDFGFSGHSPEIWDAVFAVSQGATVVEKHFTIDHDLPGRDNKFAILPSQMKELRKACDYLPLMMHTYNPVCEILSCEEEYRKYHKGRWAS